MVIGLVLLFLALNRIANDEALWFFYGLFLFGGARSTKLACSAFGSLDPVGAVICSIVRRTQRRAGVSSQQPSLTPLSN
jgi:hypothetical protein